MYTKQEKLAAARKKLKEFQGKQRENDMNRAKNVNSPAANCRESNSKSSIASPGCSHESIHANQENLPAPTAFEMPESKNDQIPNILDRKNSLTATDTTFPSVSTMPSLQGFSSNLSNKPSGSDFFNNLDNGAKQNYQNGLYANETVMYNKVEPFSDLQSSVIHGRPEKHSFVKDSQNVTLTNVEYNLTSVQPSQSYPYNNDPQEFFGSVSSFDNTQVPNAVEGNTAMPSISQLIEEKNSLMQVLKRTEELLKYKTDQEQSMAGNVVLLQTRVKELEGTLLKFENEVQDLKANNMQLSRQKAIDDNKMDQLQKKFDSKEEQFLELQQKLDLKTKECEYLNLKLNEAQSQLSSSMIKVQQLTVGESPVLSAKVVELQNENASLLYRIHDLEKNIEGLNKEKEESSLNFNNYAEQFNNQLNFLFSEVKNITKENQLLKEKNESLEKIIKDLENAKNEISAVQENQETTELSGKLEDLTAENSQLQDQLNDKSNEIESLRKLILEKTQEMNQMYSTLQQIKSENIKLLEEREGVNSNQKLLAAMESDKVAAARAVSQNQKLKDQVVELEDAFVKLSHEKLQLTDELAHEKHLKKELELRLKQLESDHNCQDELQHKSELIINEGEDIEELRNIIRQLENDKTELLSRLNPNNSVKVSSIEAEKNEHKNDDHDHDHNHSHSHEHTHEGENEGHNEESDCCKKILQQMEEKVKKTMNEIAALDEEKEKLEHLVLQLQGETETIGEYISLYQTQRMLLRQRSKEKDDQLLQLSKDKEELKSKLFTLNDLVNHLITSKGIDCSELEDVKEISETLNSEEASKVTVEKIQALITEIQSTNLINNQSVAFEHCPCCSGRLITI